MKTITVLNRNIPNEVFHRVDFIPDSTGWYCLLNAAQWSDSIVVADACEYYPIGMTEERFRQVMGMYQARGMTGLGMVGVDVMKVELAQLKLEYHKVHQMQQLILLGQTEPVELGKYFTVNKAVS